MFFAYRSGKNAVSGKAWRKLEAAEKAAGIDYEATHFPGDGTSGFVVRDGEVDYLPATYAINTPERLAEIAVQVAKLQDELSAMLEPALEAVGEFPMSELIFWMKQAKAWPPSEEDGALAPAALWKKYGPQKP